jgi:hypothetical protein
LVASFVRLAKASDEEIQQFARRWGALRLCDHLVLPYHPPVEIFKHEPCRPGPGFRESVYAWRNIAAAFGAILHAAAALYRNEVPSDTFWQSMGVYTPGVPVKPSESFMAAHFPGWLPATTIAKKTQRNRPKARRHGHNVAVSGNVPAVQQDPRAQAARDAWVHHYVKKSHDSVLQRNREAFELLLNELVDLAGLTIRVASFANDGARLGYALKRGASLSSVLCLQVILAACRSGDIFTCDACHFPYPRAKRAPHANQRNYCPACEAHEPQRWADERRRLKRQKQLSVERQNPADKPRPPQSSKFKKRPKKK